MFKLPHNCTHLTHQRSNAQNSPSEGFNSMWTENFQLFKMFKLDLEKAEEPEIKLPTSVWSLTNKESSIKTSNSALLTTPKPLTVDHNKLWKIPKERGIPDQLTCLLEVCMQVKRQQLELDMDNRLDSNWERSRSRLYIVTAYLTDMQSTSCEMPDWMKHKLESRLPGEISITSDMQITPPLWQKVKKN